MSEQKLNANDLGVVDIDEVIKAIPHRYPILMVDRVLDIIPNKSAKGIKNVTVNEPHFQGHFPGRPVMPGVMIIESMAQTAAVLVVYTLGGDAQGKLVYFMAINNARFRKPVGPGDTMHIFVEKKHSRGNAWKFSAMAKVEDRLVAEATFTAMIIDNQAD